MRCRIFEPGSTERQSGAKPKSHYGTGTSYKTYFTLTSRRNRTLVLKAGYLDKNPLIGLPVEDTDHADVLAGLSDSVGQVDAAQVLTHQLPPIVPAQNGWKI